MKRLLHILSIALILGLNPSISAMESGISDVTASVEMVQDIDEVDSPHASDVDSDDEEDSVSDQNEKIENGKEEESDSDSDSDDSNSTSSDSDSDDSDSDSEEETAPSLMEKCLDTVVLQIGQQADVEKTFGLLKGLPHELIVKVLYRFILRGNKTMNADPLLWTYAKKYELVRRLITHCANSSTTQELLPLQDALSECVQIDTLDDGLWQKLQNLEVADTVADTIKVNDNSFDMKIVAEDNKKNSSLQVVLTNSAGQTQHMPLLLLTKISNFKQMNAVRKIFACGDVLAQMPLQVSIFNTNMNVTSAVKTASGNMLQAIIPFMAERLLTRRSIKKFKKCSTINELAQQLHALPEKDCIKALGHLIVDSPLAPLQVAQLVYFISRKFEENKCFHFHDMNFKLLSFLRHVQHDAQEAGIWGFSNKNQKSTFFDSFDEISNRFKKAARNNPKDALILMALLPGFFYSQHIAPATPELNAIILKSGMLPEDYWIDNPLFAAIVKGDSELVQDLLFHGANPNAIRYLNNNDMASSPYSFAIELNGLVLAIVGNHEEIVQMLLHAGADINRPCHETGKLPIEYALESGNPRIIGMLKSKATNAPYFAYTRENRTVLDKKRWQQKKRKNAVLVQLPTVEKLIEQAQSESSDYFQNYAKKLSDTSDSNRQIAVVRERYFDAVKACMSKKKKQKIQKLEKEQLEKQERRVQQCKDAYLYDQKRKLAAKSFAGSAACNII